MNNNHAVMKTIEYESDCALSGRAQGKGLGSRQFAVQSTRRFSATALFAIALSACVVAATAAPKSAHALPPAAENADSSQASEVESSSSSSSSVANPPQDAATDRSSLSPGAAADAPEIVIDNSESLEIERPLDSRPRIVIHNIENRPKWVGSTPVRSGEVHSSAVRSGPYHLQRDAQRALNESLVQAVNEYVDEWLGVEDAHQLLSYDLAYINAQLRQPIDSNSDQYQYDEVAEHPLPVGLMHESHALLTFDNAFRSELDGRWRQIVAGKRLVQTSLAAFGVLGLLGVLFGYFKLDTATRGFYTARLQFLAAAAILALIAAGVLMAKWVPYM